MRTTLRWSLFALSLFAVGGADATCTTSRCTSATQVDATRALVADACDCAGAKSHGKYLKCAKQVVKAAIGSHALPEHCKGTVLGCEGNSTCGRSKAAVCCMVGPKGQVKSKLLRANQKCPSSGSLCQGPLAVADACTTAGACASSRRAVRSFRSVQQVFTTSCALPSCHSTMAHQGGLVLDSEDVSYHGLVGRPAQYPGATDLTRVVPGDPGASFLIRKLLSAGPGLPMPESGGPLADPIISMISSWIARGALTTEEECDQKPGACDDGGQIAGDYHWQPLPALDPPAPGDGIQLHVPPRDVPSGTEWEMCYAFRPDWTAIAGQIGLSGSALPVIKEQVYRMHPGSHHLLLYAYVGSHPEGWAKGYFPCVAANCVNASDCPVDADGIDDPNDPSDDDNALVLPIGGTQVAGTRYDVKYPEGVGVPILGPNSVLIVNPHFTNPFQPPQKTYGEAWLNLTFYKQGEFKVLLDGIFGINFAGLFVEPYETKTMSRIWRPCPILGGCALGVVDAAVFELFGHMHKRGTEFQIDYLRGGKCSDNGRICGRDSDCQNGATCARVPGAEDTPIYYTSAWDQAPIIDYPAPYFRVGHDDGLRWPCTHTNGIEGDPTHPPKRCAEGCGACGWNAASRTCIFTRGVSLGIDTAPRVYQVGDPMPLVFGQLADDDMCNMFGYFIHQDALSLLP